ncbi:helix-turn-helix protein [Kribbella orskensis]|uniref:Helix-turn-helix protein n=1 Tax=Kribbella orskensis TaxID=2512216 RepID=A0ABY2BP60_9ACTN|nr:MULTISPECIES: helix-turn-helix domain-containing protein [Kribbella]TCN39853.1 helix-turn-helix protein [Kribbella sp. VKM Ac-2500]TCO27364.1 helix-turn-helix protein [Kribbella orskensis]
MDKLSQRRITDARTLRAVAHPLRISIVEQLTVHGPMTATELGDRLDESPANCSWHLRKLAEYGFVEEAAGGTGRQRPWQITHLGMSWGDEEDGPIALDVQLAGRAMTEVVVGRELDRLLESQVRAPEEPAEWRKAATASQSMVWLTAEELEAANLAVREVLMKHFDRHQDPALRPAGSRLCALVGWGVPTYGLADETPADEAIPAGEEG